MTEIGSSACEGVTARQYTRYPDLEGKAVLITGGSSGIGAYLSFAFAVQGANVALLSLDPATGEKFCDAVSSAIGRQLFFQACDLTDIDAMKAAVARVEDRFGAIDVLINNAARDDRHELTGLSPQEWDHSINTNLRPYYFTAQSVVAGMCVRGGSIINIGSNCANLGLAGYPAYVTAKAAIVGLTRALARELGGGNIRVNTLVPGWVITERQKKLWLTAEALTQCLDEQCLKSTISGEDIAETALFLASNASRMITGQSIVVDGGRALV